MSHSLFMEKDLLSSRMLFSITRGYYTFMKSIKIIGLCLDDRIYSDAAALRGEAETASRAVHTLCKRSRQQLGVGVENTVPGNYMRSEGLFHCPGEFRDLDIVLVFLPGAVPTHGLTTDSSVGGGES